MKLAEIAEFLQGDLDGAADTEIARVAGVEAAHAGEISFLEKTENSVQTNASALIVPESFDSALVVPIIKVKNPKLAFAKIAAVLHPPKKREIITHPTAVVAESACLGKHLFIGAFVTIGENSEIGDGCQIRAGAKIGDNVRIGAGCVIHPN